MSLPSQVMRSSPQRKSPINNNPNSTTNISSNQRLRAATSFSPYNAPSSMAVRLSDGSGVGSIPPLAAVAGPMGITIVDVTAPQRPWLVLNYASTVEGGAGVRPEGGAAEGGITTMAFQPASSSSSEGNVQTEGYTQSASSSILLATARGSGILIWDCSGMSLSPLLGRLNAADSWSGVSANGGTTTSGSGNVTNNNLPPPPPPSSESTSPQVSKSSIAVSTPLTLSSLPIVAGKGSAMSVSSTSSQATSMATSTAMASAATNINKTRIPSSSSVAAAVSSTILSSGMGTAHAKASSKTNHSPIKSIVTSLAWKGPSGEFI